MPEIASMLVLSTAHLTPIACNEYLPKPPFAAFTKGDYGWFVYVTDDVPDDIPKSLLDCLEFAHDRNCGWIMFDEAGPIHDDLAIYDW